MIDWPVETYHFSRNQAHCLCSVAGEPTTSVIVTSEGGVSFYMPLCSFNR